MTTSGRFLNHVELLHRPGELDLVTDFFETLGFSHEDLTDLLGASRRITGIFAGPSGQDAVNNVLYVSEFRHPERQLDDLLNQLIKDDDELRVAIEEHDKLRSAPGDVTHFGLRYESLEELQEVVARLQKDLPAQLKDRVRVFPFNSVPLTELGLLATQGFVHTDVIGTGLFPFGQLIELQAQTPLAA